MANLFGSICLSDIPKDLITTAKNGKKYLNIEVKQMRQPSQYGYTHTVKASVKRYERKDGVNYYIGNLKVSKFGSDGDAQDTTPAEVAQVADISAPNDPNDLPF